MDLVHGSFYVGGHYEDIPDFGTGRVGQMYVEFQLENPTQPYPMVFVHGGGSNGSTWITCPDGRRGWAPFFVEHGFGAYMVDWPGVGRSFHQEAFYGPAQNRASVEDAEKRLTDIAQHRLWPQAKLHSQWPGTGRAGDPVFDNMMDARGSSGPADVALTQALTRDALSALLDRIGPAIIVTHSASGHIGWAIGDKRPEAVKALIQLEPSGPPVHDVTSIGEDAPYAESASAARPWGLTAVPLAYDPPVNDPTELHFVRASGQPTPERALGWLQAEPARRLVNLSRVPILMLTAEASYHAVYDHATSEYLDQAGVDHTYIRLEEIGIHGNGHKLNTELNNLEIAETVRRWIGDAVK